MSSFDDSDGIYSAFASPAFGMGLSVGYGGIRGAQLIQKRVLRDDIKITPETLLSIFGPSLALAGIGYGVCYKYRDTDVNKHREAVLIGATLTGAIGTSLYQTYHNDEFKKLVSHKDGDFPIGISLLLLPTLGAFIGGRYWDTYNKYPKRGRIVGAILGLLVPMLIKIIYSDNCLGLRDDDESNSKVEEKTAGSESKEDCVEDKKCLNSIDFYATCIVLVIGSSIFINKKLQKTPLQDLARSYDELTKAVLGLTENNEVTKPPVTAN